MFLFTLPVKPLPTKVEPLQQIIHHPADQTSRHHDHYHHGHFLLADRLNGQAPQTLSRIANNPQNHDIGYQEQQQASIRPKRSLPRRTLVYKDRQHNEDDIGSYKVDGAGLGF